MNNDLISREALKEKITRGMRYAPISENEKKIIITAILSDIDNAPTVAVNCKDCDGYEAGYSAGLKDAERSQGECKSCRHRDPEDKKCDCGGQERQGCLFPVSDDYYCKYYERGGAE